jgi:hypothetical protein
MGHPADGCTDDACLGLCHYTGDCPVASPLNFPPLDKEEQAQQVRAYRRERHELQVKAWAQEAQPHQSRARLMCIMNEAYNFTMQRVNTLASLGPETKEAMRSDIRTSFRSLKREVSQALAARSCSPEKQADVIKAAMTAFASLFPWADSVLCQSVSPGDSRLVTLEQRRQVMPGRCGSGVAVLSFAAANVVNTWKLDAIAARRREVLLENERATVCDERACDAAV